MRASVWQIAVLLIIGQALLGALGYFTRSLPYLSLVYTLVFIWLVVRAARAVRPAPKEKGLGTAGAVAAAALWQLPAIALLPFWMPELGTQLWQGALYPWVGLVADRWVGAGLQGWLWLAAVPEFLLFVLAAAPAKTRPVQSPAPVVAASQLTPEQKENWAAARRHQDVIQDRLNGTKN
ncbi:MAG: hypothetical protein ACM3XM_15545 [Mycobacterium leprae]